MIVKRTDNESLGISIYTSLLPSTIEKKCKSPHLTSLLWSLIPKVRTSKPSRRFHCRVVSESSNCLNFYIARLGLVLFSTFGSFMVPVVVCWDMAWRLVSFPLMSLLLWLLYQDSGGIDENFEIFLMLELELRRVDDGCCFQGLVWRFLPQLSPPIHNVTSLVIAKSSCSFILTTNASSLLSPFSLWDVWAPVPWNGDIFLL